MALVDGNVSDRGGGVGGVCVWGIFGGGGVTGAGAAVVGRGGRGGVGSGGSGVGRVGHDGADGAAWAEFLCGADRGGVCVFDDEYCVFGAGVGREAAAGVAGGGERDVWFSDSGAAELRVGRGGDFPAGIVARGAGRRVAAEGGGSGGGVWSVGADRGGDVGSQLRALRLVQGVWHQVSAGGAIDVGRGDVADEVMAGGDRPLRVGRGEVGPVFPVFLGRGDGDRGVGVGGADFVGVAVGAVVFGAATGCGGGGRRAGWR